MTLKKAIIVVTLDALIIFVIVYLNFYYLPREAHSENLPPNLISGKSLWQATGNVEVKKEPSASAKTLFYFKQGTILEELQSIDKWIKLRDINSGAEGWVARSSLVLPLSQEDVKKCVERGGASCPVVGGIEPVKESPDEKVKFPPPPGFKDTVTAGKGNILLDDPDMERFENIAETSYIVSPEKLTMIKMSSSDVNRIVCSVDIRDVVYSEEKGVMVKLNGKNAFVKFVIKRIDGKEIYSKIPVDMFVVCGDKVYNIVAIPERIPPVTVFLEDKSIKIKDLLEKNKEIPYEKRIVDYVRSFMLGKIPPEATGSIVKKRYDIYSDIVLTEEARYVIEGEGITVRVFQILSKKELEIREKDFLKKEITLSPLAISINKLKLGAGEKAILIILERTRG